MLPCLPQEIFDHPDFYVYAIEITLLTFIIGSAAFVITGEVIFYFTRIVVYLSSTKAKSQKTYKLQLHFFICLTIQITIPLLIVIVPIVYIVFAFANSHFDQSKYTYIFTHWFTRYNFSSQQHFAQHNGFSWTHFKCSYAYHS